MVGWWVGGQLGGQAGTDKKLSMFIAHWLEVEYIAKWSIPSVVLGVEIPTMAVGPGHKP